MDWPTNVCNCLWTSGHGITDGSQNHDAIHPRHHHRSSNPLGVTMAPRVRPLKACITGQAEKGPSGAALCINSIPLKYQRDSSADTRRKDRLAQIRLPVWPPFKHCRLRQLYGRIFGRIELRAGRSQEPHREVSAASSAASLICSCGETSSRHKSPRRGRVGDQRQTAGLADCRRSRGTCSASQHHHCTAIFLQYHAADR